MPHAPASTGLVRTGNATGQLPLSRTPLATCTMISAITKINSVSRAHILSIVFADLVVIPGMLHLPLVQAILADGIKVAAQNCSANPEGAFTGEVSADALSDYRIKHVLIGHSERRNDFNEGQEVIDAKMQ